MGRDAMTVRVAHPTDLDAVMSLYEEMRAGQRVSGRLPMGPGARTPAEHRAAVRARYAQALDTAEERLVVATSGTAGAVVGMALLQVLSASSVLDQPVVHLGNVVVAAGYRRRGAGRALTAAAAAFAEERGIDAVAVTLLPGHRDSHRYYARLGFAPQVVRRVATVATVRRRLGPLPRLEEFGAEVRAPGARRLPRLPSRASAVAAARRRAASG